MTFTQWLRNAFGPRVQASRAARRGKSRQPQRRFMPMVDRLEDRLAPATLMVNSNADSGTGTLRDAILASVGRTTDGLGQTGTGNDTIQFSTAVDGLTISLTNSVNDMTPGTTMAGPSAFFIHNDVLIIDGLTGLTQGVTIARSSSAAAFRLFDVASTGTLTLQGLTLKGGKALGFGGGDSDGGAGGGSAGLGGAIFNQGTLKLLDSTLTGNTAQGGAGGYSSTVSDPYYAPGGGGAGLGAAGGSVSAGQGRGSLTSRYEAPIGQGAGGGPNGGTFGQNPSNYSGGGGGNGGGGGGGGTPYIFGALGIAGRGGAGGFGGGGGGGGVVYQPAGAYYNTPASLIAGDGGRGGFGGGGGTSLSGNNGPGGYGGASGYNTLRSSGSEQSFGGGGAGMGGAVFNEAGTVIITNSTLTANTASGGRAGGIFVANPGNNGKGLGGGLFNHNGTITVTNATFSGNSAGNWVEDANVAYVFNLVFNPGDIFTLGDSVRPSTASTTATATINDTIIDGDFTGKTNGTGSNSTAGSGNLIRTHSGFAGTIVSTANPLLGPLQNNGGPTPTMALPVGSPAIDRGDNTVSTPTDQRGFYRDAAPDIGAFELRLAANMVVNTLNDTNLHDGSANDGGLSLREAIALANGTLALSALSTAEKAQVTVVAGNVNTITFASSLNGKTIWLSTVGDSTVGPSAFLVHGNIVIDGPSGNSGITLAVKAGTTMRLFDVASTGVDVTSTASLTLQNLTLSGGNARGAAGGDAFAGGAGGGSAGLGGAIFNQGSLTIQDSTLTGNTAKGGAGGSDQSSAPQVTSGAGGAGLGGAGGRATADGGFPYFLPGTGGGGGGPNGGFGGFLTFIGGFGNGGYGGFGGGGGGGLSAGYSGGNGGFGGGGGGNAYDTTNLAAHGASGNGGFGGGGGGAGGQRAAAGSGGFGGGSGGATQVDTGGGGGGAGMGGAIFNEAGNVIITNSTFTADTASGGGGGAGAAGAANSGTAGKGLGGGVFNHNGVISVTSSTFSLNDANDGGRGIYMFGDSIFATTRSTTASAIINDTIIAQADTNVDDFTAASTHQFGIVMSGKGNLIGRQTGFVGTIVSTANPSLGALQDNGGPTWTMALPPGSPAIDVGSNAVIPGLTTDQRGQPRIVNGTVDIGAFEFSPLPQTVTFGTLSPVSFGVGSVMLSATSSSGLPVTFRVISGPGTISGTILTVTGAGSIVVEADQAGNTNYAAASAQQTEVVNKASQTITFGTLSSVTFGVAPFGLSASGGASGNPVTFSVISGPGSISGTTLTVTGAGSIVVEADQAGTANYNAAAFVRQTEVVGKATQTITFSPFSPPTIGVPVTLSATSNSGLPVTFSVISGPGSISGAALTVSNVGSIVVEADQAGNANYNAAAFVQQTQAINTPNYTITFGPLSPVSVLDGPVTLSATSTSGLPVSYRVVSGPGSISGVTLTTLGLGSIVVEADQADNAPVQQTEVVNKASQTITFGPLSPVPFGVAPFTLSASGGGSDNPVTFSVISGPGSISGTTLTVLGYGNIVVQASQAGNAIYAAAFVQQTQVVTPVVSNLIVSTTNDVANGNYAPGDLSLREAVGLANAYRGGPVTITFDPTVFASPQTIFLASATTTAWLELSDTNAPTTIIGPAAGVTLDAIGRTEVLQVDAGVTASLSGITITGGHAFASSASPQPKTAFGGGLINRGTTTLTDCTISGNSVDDTAYDTGKGGGVANFSVITLIDSTISGNSITGAGAAYGGGLYSAGTATLTNCTVNDNSLSGGTAMQGGGLLVKNGTLTLTNCTVSGNSAKAGGGLFNVGAATLTNCTVSGNSATNNGGGLQNNGTLTLTDCTISGNSATGNSPNGKGGGLQNAGTATLTNCTVSGNSANSSGGGLNNTGNCSLANTIVAGNTAPTGPDVSSNNSVVAATRVSFGSGYTSVPTVTFSGGGGSGAAGTAALNTVVGDVLLIAITNGGSGYTSPPTITITGGGGSGANFAARISSLVSLGNNLIGKTDGSVGWISSDLTGTSASPPGPLDPLLSPLGNNGGPTQTMVPAANSPAIGAGNTALLAGVTTDQRGYSRTDVTGLLVDIGAVESQPIETTNPLDATVSAGQTATFTAARTGTTVQWQVSSGGDFTDIAGATGTTYAFTAAAGDNGQHYRAVFTSTADDTVTTSSAATLTVRFITINTNPVDATVNLGSTVTFTAGANANPGATVQWQFSSDNGSSFTNIVGATGRAYSFTALAGANGYQFRAVFTNTGDASVTATTTAATLTTVSVGGDLIVSNTNDIVNGTTTSIAALIANPGTDGISLREAILAANNTAGPVTITFDPTVFNTLQTIKRTGGEFELKDKTGMETIVGPAAGVTINSQNQPSRVFQVDAGVTASFSNLTVTGGRAGSGGGLDNLGTATLTNCTISGNTAYTYTPASYRGFGGGLYNLGTATLTNCTVSGNSASYGGGLENFGTATLTNCTVSGNSAFEAGGLENGGTATLTNCTLSGNTATFLAGAVINSNTANLTNCTISGNSASYSGNGGVGGVFTGGGTVTLANCIVFGNTGPGTRSNWGANIGGNSGAIISNGYNLIGPGYFGFTSGNFISGDPLLVPLAQNGGPTKTMALPRGSPAIDAGNAAGAPSTDQRGYGRSGNVDLGAFEFAGITASATVTVTTDPSSQVVNAGSNVSFTAAASADPGATVQWQVSSSGSFTDIAGATSMTYSFTAAAGDDGHQFRAVFTNTSNPSVTATTTAATLTIYRPPQTITFGTLADTTYGDADFAISATTTSGLPVTFTASGNASVSEIANVWYVHMLGGGSATITAHQAGDATYAAATDVPQSFTISPADQTISFGSLADHTWGDPDFSVGALASSGLPVTFTATGSASVSEVANVWYVHILGGGSATITAQQGGDGNYDSAADVPQSFTISPANQTITFNPLADHTWGDPDFSVSALASSGLAVTFTATGDATVTSGGLVHITGAGSATIFAHQAGDTNYHPATDIPQSFTINPANQTITFNPLADHTWGDPDFSVSALASSGLPVSFTASGSASVSEVANVWYVHILGAGSATITAQQGGDDNYAAATDVPQSFTISPADQTISFGSLADHTWGDPDFSVSALASSGLPVTFTATGDATVTSGGLVHITGAGSATIFAHQAGDTNYHPAFDVLQGFFISPANQTITFNPLANHTWGDPDFSVSALASSGLPVSFTASGSASVSEVANVWYVHILGAGSATITAQQGGDDNYAAATDVPQSFTIGQANASISVIGYSGPYDGATDGVVSSSATGVESTPADLSSLLHVDGTTYTDAPGGLVHWAFDGDTNYKAASGDAVVTINPGGSAVTVTWADGTSTTYDGNQHSATASWSSTGADGADGALTVTYVGINGTGYAAATTAPTDAGDYRASASFAGDTNHTGNSNSADFTIGQAAALFVFNGVSTTYDGAGHAASGMATGVESPPAANLNGLLSLTYSTDGGSTFSSSAPVDAGTYKVYYLFEGNTNYQATSADSAEQVVIGQATQTIAFGPLTDQIYGDADFAISATATSGRPVSFTASGDASVSQVSGVWYVHILGAGSATITAHQAGNADYAAAADDAQSFHIAQVSLTVTATGSATYGDAVATEGFTALGFVLGQDASVLGGTAVYTTSYTQGDAAGTSETVDVTGLTSSNYAISYVEGTFTVAQLSPTVTGIYPTAGPLAGGTTVTIFGTNLTGATAVQFGTTAATSFTVNSATSITATTPAVAAGMVHVSVTTPGGSSATTAADLFTFVAAATITPSNASVPQNVTIITINGSGFDTDPADDAVVFNLGAVGTVTGVNAAGTQLTVTLSTSPTSIGALDATVTTAGGPSSPAQTATVLAVPSVALDLADSPFQENGGIATVTAVLSGVAAVPVTISLSFAGTAVQGTDYSASATSITIPAGQLSGTVTLQGLNGPTTVNGATVVVTLHGGNNYTVGSPSSLTATVTASSAGPLFDELGAYRPSNGSWSLDSNGQFGFQTGPVAGKAPLADRVLLKFIPPGGNLTNIIPVSGDWAGIGTTEIGDFQGGTWYLDLNNNGILDSGETFTFGTTGDLPVPGDYLSAGKLSLAVFRGLANGDGEFVISSTNWLAEAQAGQPITVAETFIYGAVGDHVVVGDWNGAGLTEVGVYRPAMQQGAPNSYVWSLDVANHHAFDSSNKVFIFGAVGDGVVIGDWNNTGSDKVGVYRAATAFGAPNTAVFSLDETGDYKFDANSQVFLYGTPTDKFVTGRWAYTTSSASAHLLGGVADDSGMLAALLSAPGRSNPTALDAAFASS